MDKSKISVSGVSSGASFASQMHVIYSKTFMGLGMVSGGMYFYLFIRSLSLLNTASCYRHIKT